MRNRLLVLAVVFAAAVAAGGTALATASAPRIRHDMVLRFLDVQEEVQFLDVEPKGDGFSVGDTFFFNNSLRDLEGNKTLGRFVSKCVALIGTEFKCSGTLMLDRGTIEMVATPDFASESPIVPTVIGGTGRYRNVGGQATITPTEKEGESKLVVELLALG
jgi:hypothetical protein